MKTIEKFLSQKGFLTTLSTQFLYSKRKTDNADYYVTIHKKSGIYQVELSEAISSMIQIIKFEETSAKKCFEKIKKYLTNK